MNMDRHVTLLNLIAGAAAHARGQRSPRLPTGPAADLRAILLAIPAPTWVEAA